MAALDHPFWGGYWLLYPGPAGTLGTVQAEYVPGRDLKVRYWVLGYVVFCAGGFWLDLVRRGVGVWNAESMCSLMFGGG